MSQNLAQKLIAAHLVSGQMKPGSEIAIRIDQTLTQDSTGTMAYLQFEAIGVERVNTELSVAYIDHNMLQAGFENADDHAYILSVAKKHGIVGSRPGNGICHQVHLERFGKPGKTLLGSDSHTPTGGGLGMLAIGAGGLDVAVAMGGGAYHIEMPKVMEVYLTGRLSPFVSAKDVILALLQKLTVKGGVKHIIEYTGPGVATLSVPERATITNMGAELGATTSVFPSDEATRVFLRAQGRETDFLPLSADEGAAYDARVEIDLASLVPLAAQPHSPDNVAGIRELGPIKVDQVCIGSCTNASYRDLMTVACMLKGRKVAEGVSLTISPGSKQVLTMLAQNGALADIIAAGARVLECACGPCIGMGQAPKTGAVSVRTFNRNFYARSGTASASVYLVSPEAAAATAVTGVLSDPRDAAKGWGLNAPDISMPQAFVAEDNLVTMPAAPDDAKGFEVVRGPNIKPFPVNTALEETVSGKVLLVLEDNITTDHIMPSNAHLLPFRSNIPYLSEHCFAPVDKTFPGRAQEAGGGFIVAGNNYGQGSSREHAALVPLYLGIKGVVAKSFARIHMANLINSGILPLVFADPADYERMEMGDELTLRDAQAQVARDMLRMHNVTKGYSFDVRLDASVRQRTMLRYGGLLNATREGAL